MPKIYSSFFLSLFLFSSNYLQANEVTFNRPSNTPQAAYVIELLSAAYKQSGYDIKLIDYPRDEALRAANEGKLDGQLGRIAEIELLYQNLVRLPTPLFTFNLLLIHRCNQCTDCQINDFKSVSIVSNYPVAKAYLTKMNYSGEVIDVRSIKTQLALLNQNKIESIIVLDFQLKAEVGALSREEYQLQILSKTASYHYLNNQQPDLFNKISKTLHAFEQSGFIAQLKEKHNIN